MATNRIRISGQWYRTEDSAPRMVIPFDTGTRTFTESIHGTLQFASNTSRTIDMQTLTQGNFLYVKCSTGPVIVAVKSAVTNTNSVTLLTGGFVIHGYVTFAACRIKNKASTTSTVQYYIAGD